jgi:hypothetical protein
VAFGATEAGLAGVSCHGPRAANPGHNEQQGQRPAPQRAAAPGGEERGTEGGVRHSVSLSNLVSGFSGAFVMISFRIIELIFFKIGFA